MPRGIYPRKKKDGTTSTPVVETHHKAAAAKTHHPKVKTKATTKAHHTATRETGNAPVQAARSTEPPQIAIEYAFNILGSNVTTLSSSFKELSEFENIASELSSELVETVHTLKALRLSTFGHLLPKDTSTPLIEAAPEPQEEEEEQPLAAIPQQTHLPTALPVPPVLPQGAPGFQPPAPPIPHH